VSPTLLGPRSRSSKDGGKEKAPAKSGGGRRRRKWSKGKQKEKVNNAMLFDQPTTYDKLLSEVMDMLGPSLWDGSEKLFWEHQKGGEGKDRRW